jgi:hypothetical protein
MFRLRWWGAHVLCIRVEAPRDLYVNTYVFFWARLGLSFGEDIWDNETFKYFENPAIYPLRTPGQYVSQGVFR